MADLQEYRRSYRKKPGRTSKCGGLSNVYNYGEEYLGVRAEKISQKIKMFHSLKEA